MSTTSIISTIAQTEVFTIAGDTSSEDWDTYVVTYTNLGPLTTTFTPPSSNCYSWQPANIRLWSNSSIVSLPCSVYNGNLTSSSLSCEPSGLSWSSLLFAKSSEISSDTAVWASLLSPGLYCPHGYTTGTSAALAQSDLETISSYTLRVPGTHVQCCLRGYTWDQSLDACASTITTATSTDLCDYYCTNPCVNYRPSSYANGSMSCALTSTCGKPQPFTWSPQDTGQIPVVYRNAVYMIHHKHDFPGHGNLSTPATIAISVVIPVVVIAALIGMCFFIMKKLRQTKTMSFSKGSYADVRMQSLNGATSQLAEDPISLIPKHEMPKRRWHWV
ncbi:hypothetical protein M409DRAFT_54130 [Zasmidium cellare ATCC 36951]|uniref:Uncharacterized protein n=1 Tax=Zasmidium cellare ATCC 36951 TaxID=1080233 RepID=A0A6A6CLM1_ZASCE|nr:uncharacterized protein M409DRAFT_54130 [Zasmidium cellare ATCC 36951]KAF2167533.1 hypothetical protein M409DRAFT_54130 [Zasmidium cellare ATCC 36951]